MPISYLPFEQRKCGWVPRGLVYSVPPFIIFNAKHTGAGFPFTGNSGLKYRHVPHIFSGFDCPGQLLFPIVAPFPFVLCLAFIPWVPFRHFDPVYFYFGTGEHLAEKFRHCSHLLWDVERLGFLCSGQIPRTGQLSQSSFRTTSPGLSASLNPRQLSLRADASAKFSIASTATFANM